MPPGMVAAKRTLAVTLACWGLVLAAAGAAQAAPGWLASTKLSPATFETEKPAVAVNEQGDSVAAWGQVEGLHFQIQAAGRPAGAGGWQSPVAISAATGGAFFPQVGIDAHGDAVAVWLGLETKSAEYSVEASSRKGLAGAWSAPVTLSLAKSGVNGSFAPGLAVDAQGDAVVAWQSENGGEKFVEASYMSHTGGTWGAPVGLSNTVEDQSSPGVGIDAAGDATAVWEDHVGGHVRIVQRSRPAATGTWQTPITISSQTIAFNANIPKLAVGPEGNAAAIWEQFNNTENMAVATRATATSAWSAPVELSVPLEEPSEQQVAVGGHGVAVAVWKRDETHKEIAAAQGSTATGAWTPAVILSATGKVAEAPTAAVDALGNATAMWIEFPGATATVEAARKPFSSASWESPVPFPTAGTSSKEPQIAADAQGDATAVFEHHDGANWRVEAAGFDGAGPHLGSPVIPTSGTTGQTLAFSVSPFDVWSALGATTWSFGDGTTQSGASVTHAYSTAGNHTVTVTSSDVLGNATSTSATIAISAAKPILGPPLQLIRPVISAARLSHTRFRVARRATAISARRAPQATSFLFTLSQASSVQIAFRHPVGGLRSGRRCVAPTAKLRRRHAKRCTRTLTVGTLTRAHERKGRNSVYFSGRIGTRALAPGNYTAVLTATSGGLRSTPVALSLSIVR